MTTRISNVSLLNNLKTLRSLRPLEFNAVRNYAVYCASELHGRYISKHFEETYPKVVGKLISANPKLTVIMLVRTIRYMTPNICKLCGRVTSWQGRSEWLTYCSAKCRANCPELRKQKEDSYFAVHGVTTNLATKEHQIKKTKTLLAKTGYAHAAQNPATQKKTIRTNLQRYGAKNPMQNKDVVEHLKDSLESKHGVRATWHIPGVQEKKNASMLERHGDTCPIRVPRIAEKVRATNVARYGVDNPYKSKAIMEKVQDCREKRTGYRNSGQNPAVRKKASDTIFKRTGYRHQMQDPKVFGRQQSSLRGQKPWVDKFGNTHMVRGCEPTVNSALEALGATVLSCEPKDMPPIRYVGKDGKTHRYFPDTVAKVGNTRWVIEAKERNGLLTRPGEFDKNKLKFSAAISRCSRYPDTVFVLGFMLKDKTVKFVKNPTSEKIEKIKALFN